MYELVQVGAQTYYINCPAKMGIWHDEQGAVWLIDSGNDKEAGRKVSKILEAQNWHLQAIINTHSNADHIGGNKLLYNRTDAPIYSTPIEAAFTAHPVLEPSFLYGGYPMKALRNKFLMAQPSPAQDIAHISLPDGMSIFPLPGHYFAMIGVRTPDDVCFMADCVQSPDLLDKYHISFIYDVAAYLQTLRNIEAMSAACFVPAHADVCDDMASLSAINRAKVEEIITLVLECCALPCTAEQLLKRVFDHYGLSLDMVQYVLAGSTLRSYVSYLADAGRLVGTFTDNMLYWQKNDTTG